MNGIEHIAELLRTRRDVLVVTGAGISTASGIPGYRDKEGVRQGRQPIQGPEFRKSDAVRRRYWARSMVGYKTLQQARPNPAHQALAQIQQQGWLAPIVTQNVDGLHAAAGSESVIELHGNIHRVLCLDCGAVLPRAAVQAMLEDHNPALAAAIAQPAPDGDAHIEPDDLEGFAPPWCPHCGGLLKPDVVFFGDSVPPTTTRAAMDRLAACDAVLVVGSSLMVFSGYRFAKIAADHGKPVAAINLGRTRADPLLEVKVEAPAEQALPALAQLLT
ncbi:MAG TPA: NAD-dependent protein deacetylase [Telluria sp.]|nr:NAD-dependent protein deacetylase [Telluria sp.]